MRGDRPLEREAKAKARAFTPHARGSTLAGTEWDGDLSVYPACAGIDLGIWRWLAAFLRLPRMRGDRPPANRNSGLSLMFTPHARGSTLPKAT